MERLIRTEAREMVPNRPTDKIAFRRWWNQVIMYSITYNMAPGCMQEKGVDCHHLLVTGDGLLPCNRCYLEANMVILASTAYIGIWSNKP